MPSADRAGPGGDAPPKSKRWIVAGAAAVVIAAALTVGSYFYFDSTPQLTERDSVVVAGSRTRRAIRVLMTAHLRQGLSTQLEQTPYVRLVSGDQIAETLNFMEKPPDTQADAGGGARGFTTRQCDNGD